MKVGIDARWIFRETSGISTYTRELIRELVRLEPPHEFVLFFDDEERMRQTAAEVELGEAERMKAMRVPYGLFSVRTQLFLPALLKKEGIDVFHSPNYMIPFRVFPRRRAGRVRCVVTIHDLIPLRFPEFTPKAKKTRFMLLYRKVMEEVGARADLILTVSEHSRQDVIREMQVPEERVTAVPNGVSAAYRPEENAGKADPRVILYVGRFDPYKNVEGLIRIFARVRQQMQEDVRLRIIGSPDPRYPEPRRLAEELGVGDRVDWSGYADEDALAGAYHEADVFVLPSRYEGFGLTVLEAMASGAPVVCSNVSSLPEVAGDAALLADPGDEEGFAQAVRRVLEDKSLAEDLSRRGLEQAKRFTWRRTAETTLEAYETVFGMDGR